MGNPLTSPHHLRTNQNPWPAWEIRVKPGKEEPIRTQHLTLHQKVTNQTRRPVFLNFSRDNTLYKQCNPELRAPPYSCCVGNGGSPSSSLVIKTLALASDIGSLVVIGRFRDLGITQAGEGMPCPKNLLGYIFKIKGKVGRGEDLLCLF